MHSAFSQKDWLNKYQLSVYEFYVTCFYIIMDGVLTILQMLIIDLYLHCVTVGCILAVSGFHIVRFHVLMNYRLPTSVFINFFWIVFHVLDLLCVLEDIIIIFVNIKKLQYFTHITSVHKEEWLLMIKDFKTYLRGLWEHSILVLSCHALLC